LLGITSLYIASKLEELYPASIESFVNSTDGGYTKDELKQMEKNISKTLKY